VRGLVYPETVTIFDPAEKSYEVPVVGGRVTWRQTGRAGVYRMEARKSEKKGAPQATIRVPPGFVLTPDPEESDPEYRSPDEVKRALGLPGAIIIDSGADLNALVAITRQGRELFGYFIFAALVLILAEVVLANMLGIRMKAPQELLSTVRRNESTSAPGLSLSGTQPKPEEAPAETGVNT
jgi:hypothetical protein